MFFRFFYGSNTYDIDRSHSTASRKRQRQKSWHARRGYHVEFIRKTSGAPAMRGSLAETCWSGGLYYHLPQTPRRRSRERDDGEGGSLSGVRREEGGQGRRRRRQRERQRGRARARRDAHQLPEGWEGPFGHARRGIPGMAVEYAAAKSCEVKAYEGGRLHARRVQAIRSARQPRKDQAPEPIGKILKSLIGKESHRRRWRRWSAGDFPKTSLCHSWIVFIAESSSCE